MEETPAEVETETEKSEQERQAEKVDDEIRDIADGLRDLAIRMDTIKGNSATTDMRGCVQYFWRQTKSGYERKTLTTLEAIALIEEMPDIPKTMSDWHKDLLPADISAKIDAIFRLVQYFLRFSAGEIALVKAFLKTDAGKQYTTRLQEEARRPDAELVYKRRKLHRTVAEELRRAAEQALQKQKALENARDLEPKDTWSAARVKLAKDVGAMHKTYKGLVWRVGDAVNFAGYESAGYLHTGDILGGLIVLADKLKTQRFYRSWDTYRCCEFLRDCTKYLACDGRYKREGYRSTDDRFTGVYQGNYQFRRSWVALLLQIAGYVEMLCEDDAKNEKLYENAEKLADMWPSGQDRWDGYVWSTVKQHITTAQEAINKEPEESGWSKGFRALKLKAKLDALKELAEG